MRHSIAINAEVHGLESMIAFSQLFYFSPVHDNSALVAVHFIL
jgi:hypothetical protein